MTGFPAASERTQGTHSGSTGRSGNDLTDEHDFQWQLFWEGHRQRREAWRWGVTGNTATAQLESPLEEFSSKQLIARYRQEFAGRRTLEANHVRTGRSCREIKTCHKEHDAQPGAECDVSVSVDKDHVQDAIDVRQGTRKEPSPESRMTSQFRVLGDVKLAKDQTQPSKRQLTKMSA